MTESKHIGQIIAERVANDLNIDPNDRKFKLSERLWNDVQVHVDTDTDEESNERLKAYWKAVNSKTESVIDARLQRLIFDDFYRSVLKVGEDLTEDEYINKTKSDKELVSLINSLLNWYFKVGEFKKGGFYIYSPPGIGKTSLMRALFHMSMLYGKKNNLGSIIFHDLNKMIGLHKRGERQDFSFYNDENIIIDDLSERMNHVVHFGDKYDISEIIESRYSVWKNTGKQTIITSNIYPFKSNSMLSLESLLTARCIDRLNEQYEVIILTGESKRK